MGWIWPVGHSLLMPAIADRTQSTDLISYMVINLREPREAEILSTSGYSHNHLMFIVFGLILFQIYLFMT